MSSGIVKNPERYTKLGAHSRLAELPFYNFFRGDVLTANHWQAGADNTLILKMMMELEIDPSLCPETDASESLNGKIKFDKSKLFAMGFFNGRDNTRVLVSGRTSSHSDYSFRRLRALGTINPELFRGPGETIFLCMGHKTEKKTS